MSEERMDQVPVVDGDWTLEVVDDPHGIVLRAPPERPKFLSPGERIRCDRRVKAAGETVTFYRVAGTEGWVLDVKGPHATSDTSNKRGWSIEFVSGLALAFDLEEMSCNQTSNILSSRTMDEKRSMRTIQPELWERLSRIHLGGKRSFFGGIAWRKTWRKSCKIRGCTQTKDTENDRGTGTTS
mmetsp:Transcript_1947/g.3894  ORF Transcript_1947/g.3894 Transcript_1947/m.3894 type:complete len:183 (+) Transcript_1947:892-1440(+)